MAIQIEDVITEFGAVYRDGGQSQKDVMARLTQKSVTEEAISDIRITENTRIEKANSSMTRVLQAYQKAWTPIGDSSFELETINLYKWKIDAECHPDEIEESWLGFLASSNVNRAEWPLVKYWVEQILKQYESDFEKHEIFKGVRGAITPNVATAAGATMNGFNKIINDLITASKIAPIIDDVVPTDPVEFVTYVETMVEEIPAIFHGLLEKLRMSEELGKRFVTGNDRKYNGNYRRQDNVYNIHNTPLEIQTHKNANGVIVPGLPSHAGSNKIWTTIQGNTVTARKKASNHKTLRLETLKRQVFAMTDGYVGVGVWYPGYVFTNDK